MNYRIENTIRTKYIKGKAKDFDDLKKKVVRKLKWRRIHDLENYFIILYLSKEEIEKLNIKIEENIKKNLTRDSVNSIVLFYNLSDWKLLNEDIYYMMDEETEEVITYDFYTHPEIKEYDIVYCHFDNQYYIALEDMSDPWGYNSDKLSGGNLYPEVGILYGVSQYYIEKVERENVPKNILEALNVLIECFKDGTHDPIDHGRTFEIHRKICEAQGIEFDDYV